MEHFLKHKLILATIAIQIVALPLVLFAVKEKQETRTQASATTTLSFSPASTSSAPHSINLGQEFPVDVIVTPVDDLISLAKLEINYDPAKITLSPTNPILVNAAAFPQIIEGPVYTNGKIQLVVSIGFDRTRVIQAETKVLTINFKANSSIDQTQVFFGTNSGLYSLGTDDSSNLSVLSSTTPLYVKVNAGPTPSPKPTNTPTPTPTSAPASVPTIGTTTILFNELKLHGLGKGGDSPNPNSAGTLNPLRTTRDLTIEIYDVSSTLITSAKGYMEYTVPTEGVFDGIVELPSTIANGDYLITIRTPYYLGKRLSGSINIVKGQENNVASTALIAGDVNLDNKLSVLDYDIIMGCYSDLSPAKNCDAAKKLAADISDDGKVNQDDYNLFLREISVQQGE